MDPSEQQALSASIDLLVALLVIWFIVSWAYNYYEKVKKQVNDSDMSRRLRWAQLESRNRLDAERARKRFEKAIHSSCYSGYRSAPPK